MKKVDSKIKLSICIATLNRGNLIGETLDSIVSQLTNQVEIVIIDGASTDNTSDVVRSYQQRYANIGYTRLKQKGGVDQDYSRAVALAAGEYCWLFSDDDIIKPGAIETILKSIDNGQGLLIVNAEIRDAKLKRILKTSSLKIKKDIIYNEYETEKLFQDTASFLSFIGCVVIKRSVWEARDKKSYFGTFFVHVGVIFQQPIREGVKVIAEPLIAIRYGNALWTEKAFEVTNFKWPELIWSFSGITKVSKAKVCKREPWRNIFKLMFFRGRGIYSKVDFIRLIKKEQSYNTSLFLMYVIAIVPVRYLNLLFVLYFKTLGSQDVNSKLNILDLMNTKYNRTN